MIQQAIEQLISGDHLTFTQASEVMDQVMEGALTPAQVAGFLVALAAKGETEEEVAGCAASMRRHVTAIPAHSRPLLDTCGTGGDGSHTFNISTAAAFVAAGAGAHVAKHGNRSATSSCGSAEVLEALGIVIDQPPDRVAQAVDALGIGFLYARTLHPSMRHAAPVRGELKVRTVFNLLGPLTNPAGATRQVIGVARPEFFPALGGALQRLGTERAWLVCGAGGVDELVLQGPSHVLEVTPEGLRSQVVDPLALGLSQAPLEALRGADPATNARILEDIFQGRDRGPRRAVVLLNAAAALVVAGLSEDLQEGLKLAGTSIDSGAAWDRVCALRQFGKEEIA